MKTKHLLTLAITASLAACGGGGGGDTTPPPATSTTAAQTSSTSTQSATAAGNATETLSNLSNMGLDALVGGAPSYRSPLSRLSQDARAAKMHKAELRAVRTASLEAAKIQQAAKAAAADGTATIAATTACSVSGTYDYTVVGSTINMTFSACRESTPDGYGEELNGPVTFTVASSTATSTTMTMTMGNGNDTIEPGTDYEVKLFSDNFANFYASYIADLGIDVGFTMNDGGTPADYTDDSYEYTYAAAGQQSYSEFTEVYTLAYVGFTANSTMTGDGLSGTNTINGQFNQTWANGSEGVAITYTNLALGWAEVTGGFDYTVDGTIDVNFTPDVCAEGSNTLDTTTPVHFDYAAGHTTAGVVTVNGTTTVTYNANGSVTVSDANGSTTYTSESAMSALCPVQDMSEPTEDTNDTGEGTAEASKLLATLSWTGGATSDMDLHLTYYTTGTPDAATVPSGYASFAGMTPCQSPLDASMYWSGIDANSDGVCELGLDYDDTEGYGPEHITATTLADGYYMVAVNSYDLDTDSSAAVTVTVDVGGTLFTFDSHTFTTADYLGTDPNSWYRVADIRVSGGTATVMAPNTNLLPWAAYTLMGYAAPRVK
jgi:hypothetical protein